MKRVLGVAAVLITAAGTASASQASRLNNAANAVTQIRLEIPQEYWTKARCVVVIPELKKAAFIFGGEYGKGVMSCRAGDQGSAIGRRQGVRTATRSTRPTTTPTTDEDIRGRLVDLQQSVDRMLADTTPAPVGTSGTVGSSEGAGPIAVDRARLLQLRQQIDAILATLNRR